VLTATAASKEPNVSSNGPYIPSKETYRTALPFGAAAAPSVFVGTTGASAANVAQALVAHEGMGKGGRGGVLPTALPPSRAAAPSVFGGTLVSSISQPLVAPAGTVLPATVASKEPQNKSTEPDVMSKEPYIQSKEPYIPSREGSNESRVRGHVCVCVCVSDRCVVGVRSRWVLGVWGRERMRVCVCACLRVCVCVCVAINARALEEDWCVAVCCSVLQCVAVVGWQCRAGSVRLCVCVCVRACVPARVCACVAFPF